MAYLFDPAEAQEGEPETVTVGDFIQWKKTALAGHYDPTLYTATYVARISGGGNAEIQIEGTDGGGYFYFAVSSVDSANFISGYYYWQLEIVRNSDSERVVVDRGNFTTVDDLDVNQADPRSHAEIMLTKIESLLSGRADADVSSYSIAGRSLSKLSFQELIDAKAYYQGEVNKERREQDIKAGRGAGKSTIQVRF
jgi:hypothetical protein